MKKKNKGIWRKAFPQYEDIKFKDNRQRFRRFGRLKKDLNWISFSISSIISLIVSIIPLIWKKNDSIIGWVFWGIGMFISVFFEQISNYHYKRYSLMANKKDINNVKMNILVNKIMRTISFLGLIFSFFAIAIISISVDGSFASIWG